MTRDDIVDIDGQRRYKRRRAREEEATAARERERERGDEREFIDE